MHFCGCASLPAPPRAASSVARQFLSTVAKRLYSVGSCFWMSELEKMGSRYIQLRCTLSHSSSTSAQVLSVAAQRSMRSAKGFLKAEKAMACVMVVCSSSSACCSSTPLTTKVPDSRYAITSIIMPCHSPAILSSACSSWYSLPAFSPTFSMSAMCLARFFSSTIVSVKASLSLSGSILSPICSDSSAQWRVRMPGLRSATTSGTSGLKASHWSRTVLATVRQPSLPIFSKALTERLMLRAAAPASRSIVSGLRLMKAPSIQSWCCLSQLLAVSQSVK